MFLDGGVALADLGVFGFVDEGPEFFEDVQVGGVGVAVVREGEVEGLLFEEFEGVHAEGWIAGGGVLADFFRGFFGVVEAMEMAEGFETVGVTDEGHVRNFFVEILAAEFGNFAGGDPFLNPRVDVLELALGEDREAGERTAGRRR